MPDDRGAGIAINAALEELDRERKGPASAASDLTTGLNHGPTHANLRHPLAVEAAVRSGELITVGQSGEHILKRIETAGERASGGSRGLGR